MIWRQAIAATAVLLRVAHADKYHGPQGADNSSAPTTVENGVTIHWVTVGKLQNQFFPNSIQADVGDIISFNFYPTNHSVIRAAFGYPCVPYEDIHPGGHQWYSSFMPVSSVSKNPPQYNITVNHTNPDFFYCGATGSCIDWGMLGAINANATQTVAKQIKLAHQADFMLEVGEKQPSEAQQASLSALAHHVTTETTLVTTSAAPTTTTSSTPTPSATATADSSGLSTGAVAGIAVGAAVGALVLAGLFFLLCRTRSLKRKLDAQEAENKARNEGPLMSPYAGSSAYDSRHNSHYQSQHHSQLPPYPSPGLGGVQQFSRDSQKPSDSDSYYGDGRRTMSPQQSGFNFGPQFSSLQQPDGRFSHSTTSEMHGSQPPVVELESHHPEMAQSGMRYA